jgi:hypothetical protein
MRYHSLLSLLALSAACLASAQNERLVYGITLDGKTFDRATGCSGGTPMDAFDLLPDKNGGYSFHLTGQNTFTPIEMQIGGSAPNVFQWVHNFCETGAAMPIGEIDTLSSVGGKMTTKTTFSNALITEIGLPGLDAGAKDAAKMVIKVKPEYTKSVTVRGWDPATKKPLVSLWSRSHFNFHIDGLDTPSNLIIIAGVGVGYSYAKKAAILDNQRREAPLIRVSSSIIGQFQDWQTAFRASGGDPKLEKDGAIDYFATDGAYIGTLQLHGLGILNVESSDMDSDTDTMCAVRFYCQSVSFLPAVQ